jgi:hypothetical protein
LTNQKVVLPGWFSSSGNRTQVHGLGFVSLMRFRFHFHNFA